MLYLTINYNRNKFEKCDLFSIDKSICALFPKIAKLFNIETDFSGDANNFPRFFSLSGFFFVRDDISKRGFIHNYNQTIRLKLCKIKKK